MTRSLWQVAAGLAVLGCLAGWVVRRGPAEAAAALPRWQTALGKLPVYFIQNQGQLDARVAYSTFMARA